MIQREQTSLTKLVVCLIFLVAWLALPAAGVVAAEESRDNLIADHGFEMTQDSPWIYNDWWVGDQGQKNEVGFVREADRPRSGAACLRMALKTKRGGNLQLTYPLAGKLKEGEAIQIRFWIRGPANSPGPTLILDKDGPPWTEYYRVNVALSEDWSEKVYNLTLPPKTDSKKLRLQFLLEEENTFWLDDVSLRRLPEKEEGAPLPGNRVANGSFETGRNRWYTRFQESGQTPAIPRAVEQNIAAEMRAEVAKDAPAGRRVLRLSFKPGCSAHLTSALFPLRYGHPVNVSFHARCPGGKGELSVSLSHGEFPNITSIANQFKDVSAEWKRYTFQAVPTPSTGGTYYLHFTSYSPGAYEFDDVRVQEPNAPEGRPGIELGWRTVDDAHPGNIHYRDEAVKFHLSAFAPGHTGNLELQGKVVDVWEKQVARITNRLALDSEGYGEAEITLPSERYGAFKCEFRAASDGPGATPDDRPLLLELVYHVVPKLTPLKEVKDSYFGGHFDMTPYNLGIAEKGGYRWLRLHPPMNTKWEVVETRQGVFRFHLDGVRRAHAMGFRILGNFQATPDFYADTPKGQSNDWWDNWAPKEEHMDAYERYVKETAKAFGEHIHHWEIWNEPDICFFNVPPGRDRTQAYLEICRRTRKALDESGIKDCFLVGGAVTDNDRPFTMEILEKGMGGAIDAFSFHHYSSGLDALIRRGDRIKMWRAFKNREGKPLPMWQTESGIYSGPGASWLRTSGRPAAPGHAMNVAAARTVQNLVYYKAIGVEKFFTYPLVAHPAGRTISRNDWESVIDVNGIPYSPLPAHAAAVYFLEGATPVEQHVSAVGDATVFVARFTRDGKPIEVAWSSQPVRVGQVKALQADGRRAYDMMGNAMDQVDALTNEPVYFIVP